MSVAAKKKASRRAAARTERTVVYRGIRIEPVAGKRSAIARAIRDGLVAKIGETREETARP